MFYHGYGLSFVCRRTWIWIFVTIFSHRPHWYFFKLPNCLAIKTCFCPVWLIAVIVKPSAVGVVDIVDDKFLLTFGILLLYYYYVILVELYLNLYLNYLLLISPIEMHHHHHLVHLMKVMAIVDERILFVVVASNVAGCLRRPPRVFIGS